MGLSDVSDTLLSETVRDFWSKTQVGKNYSSLCFRLFLSLSSVFHTFYVPSFLNRFPTLFSKSFLWFCDLISQCFSLSHWFFSFSSQNVLSSLQFYLPWPPSVNKSSLPWLVSYFCLLLEAFGSFTSDLQRWLQSSGCPRNANSAIACLHFLLPFQYIKKSLIKKISRESLSTACFGPGNL